MMVVMQVELIRTRLLKHDCFLFTIAALDKVNILFLMFKH